MFDEVQKVASVQYDDMRGTIALDRADFKGLREALDVPDDQTVVGLHVWTGHPPLLGHEHPFAESSYTGLTLWTIDSTAIPKGAGVPGLAGTGDVEVTEWSYDTTDVEFGMPTDAWSLLLLASKRLEARLWVRGLWGDDAQFIVAAERRLEHDGTGWRVVRSEP